MRTRVIKIGNSQGFRIPKPILDQTGIRDDVEIEVENNQIIIRPVENVREGWDAAFKETKMTKQSQYPKGWDEARVKRVLDHYESQTEDKEITEDEAAYEDEEQTFIEVPNDLVPAVRELIAKKGDMTSNI